MTRDAASTGEMSEVDRYQFDRQGYLVIENVLNDDEVAELNRLIDDQNLPEPPRKSSEGRFRGFLEWGEPFCDLLDHERVVPILREILGDDHRGEGFRLDHYYGIYLRGGTPSSSLHNGGTPYKRGRYHHYQNGGMYDGMTVVAWNLRDAGPEYGGFCCLPGSHKSNFACPDDIHERFDAAETMADLPESVVVPEAPAGSVTVFTEALTHGTTPWVADHVRRSLLFMYNPGHAAMSGDYPEPPENVDMTSRQEKILQPPSYGDRGVFD